MNEIQLKNKIYYIEQFNHNLNRILKTRIRLAKDRRDAFKNVSKDFFFIDMLIKPLENGIKHEKKLIQIIDKGIEESYSDLKEAKDWLKKHTKNHKEIKLAKKLITYIKLYKKTKDITLDRIKAQEKFVMKKDEASLNEFANKCNKENKLNSKIIKHKLNITKNKERLIKTKIIFKSAIKGGIIGGLFGGIGSMYRVYDEKSFMYAPLYFGLLGAIIATFNSLNSLTEEFNRVNEETFLKMKKYVK